MCQHLRCREDRLTIVFAALSLGLLALTTTGARAEEPAPVKIGIVTFLTGPVAAPFGIRGHPLHVQLALDLILIVHRH